MKSTKFFAALIALLALGSSACAETYTSAYTLVPPAGNTTMDYSPGAYNEVGTLKITADKAFTTNNRVSVIVQYDGKFTNTEDASQTVEYSLVKGTKDSYTVLKNGDAINFSAASIDSNAEVTIGAVISGSTGDVVPYTDNLAEGNYRSNIAFNAYLEPAIGNPYTFGSYNNQALTWVPIAVDHVNKRILLLSKTPPSGISDRGTAGTMTYDSNVWANTNIRTWLNDTFFNSAFTEEQKSMIAEVVTEVENTTEYKDKVFLLSEGEYTTYVGADYWKLQAITYRTLLRTFTLENNTRCLKFIKPDGTIDSNPVSTEKLLKSYAHGYIYPALWLKYDN